MESFLSSVLAPKLEKGQEALFDALRAGDNKRATRIINRVARDGNAYGSKAEGSGTSAQGAPEADLNATDSRGLRPIHLAAMRGMSESVAALLRAGVPVDTMGAEGNTALHLAAFHKEEGVVAVLMRAGASPTLENMRGSTAVHLAKTETTLTLLCPLHYCAARGMLDNLVSEVAKGRSVNTVGKRNNTPLHAAATAGNLDSIRLLLDRGADPLRKNDEGETPLDVARRNAQDARGGRVPGGIVGVLESATQEAAAALTAREAVQAASREKGAYREGEAVVYMRDGEAHPAVVMKVHPDDEEPYYTVRVNATGRERQTDANHLVRTLQTGVGDAHASLGGASSSSSSACSPGSDGAEGTGEEEPAGSTGATDGKTHSSSSSSIGLNGSVCRQEPVEGEATGGGDAWAAAQAKLLGLAADLDKAAVGSRDSTPLAQALVSALAAMPAAEVGAILARQLVAGKNKRRGECTPDSGGLQEMVVEDALGGVAGGRKEGEGVVVYCRGEREDRERIASALADSCRDMVLECLAGWRAGGKS